MPDIFEKRIRRAEFLQKEWPFAADVLDFYRAVTAFQRGMVAHPRPPETAFRELLELVRRHGPPPLAEIAERGPSLPAEPPGPDADPALALLVTLIHQPAAMLEAVKTPQDPSWNPGEAGGDCPRCGRPPLVGVLREDKAAEAVRRSLVCSYCSLEWDFPRILCPACREEKPEKLPRYSAQEIPWMRVEACDSCGKYLKSVDLTLNWDADPVVDELASTPLDVIAREHGYAKISPNLAGI
jgi:formate dehydrogenase maturation protein FdhE